MKKNQNKPSKTVETRGRKPSDPADLRRKHIPVGVSQRDIEQLRADAAARGLTLSVHVRDRLGLPHSNYSGHGE